MPLTPLSIPGRGVIPKDMNTVRSLIESRVQLDSTTPASHSHHQLSANSMETLDDLVLHDLGEYGVVEPSENHAGNQEFSLPRADGGKEAWLFLAACFIVEALVWGL
jgi:hypothetical protein